MANAAPNPPPAADVTIDLDDSGALAQGIAELRDWYGAHRTGAVTVAIRVGGELVTTAFINTHNLYIEAFHASGTWYHFSDAVLKPGVSTALPIGGAHRNIGTPKIASFDAGFQWMLGPITGFAGGTIGETDDIRKCLSFLVIAISEAARFASVLANIGEVLDYKAYDPRSDCELKMTKWSKLTKAADPDVVVPYLD